MLTLCRARIHARTPAPRQSHRVVTATQSIPSRLSRSVRGRRVRAAASPEERGPEERASAPGKAESYTSRLLKLEQDPTPGRDNLKSNLKLAAGVTALLVGLVYAFLASNGAL